MASGMPLSFCRVLLFALSPHLFLQLLPCSLGPRVGCVRMCLFLFPFRECRPVVCRFFYEFKQSQLFLVSSPALEVEYSQLSHVMVVPHLLFYMYNNIARLFLLFSAVFSWFLSKFNIIELRKTLFQSPHAYSSASCSIIADLASFMCFITLYADMPVFSCISQFLSLSSLDIL